MSSYRGRFAPSPTGPLHFGSLVAATASYLDARANGGEWLVRIEDLDTPRVVADAADGILRDLEHFGFVWDGEVLVQSRRIEAYREALARLETSGLVYPCGCSRKEIADSALGDDAGGASGDELRYPGTCANGLAQGKSARAWRVRTEGAIAEAAAGALDAEVAALAAQVSGTVGDFVLLRADGIFSYQLAVVVDDAAQGITDVVRGADLLDSTPRQRYLQRLLGYTTPRYKHIPVVLAADGQKLSKQTGAAALNPVKTGELLWDAFAFLGLDPPATLRSATPREMWPWAVAHYDPSRT